MRYAIASFGRELRKITTHFPAPDGLSERALKPPTSLDLESARLKAADTPALALTMSSIKSATGCTEPALPHTTASKASPWLRPSGRSLRKPMEMRWS